MKQTRQPQPQSDLRERLKKSIGRKACLIALLLAVPLSQVPAQQVSNPAASPADAKTVDAGDSYTADGHSFKLKRIANQIVVKTRAGADRFKQDFVALGGAKTLRRAASLRDDLAVWQDDSTGTADATRLAALLETAKADPETEYAFPVYLVEGHNLRLYGGDELVLQLKSGTSRARFEQLLVEQRLRLVKPLEKFEDTYIVRLFNPKTDDGLAAVGRLMVHPEVEWAEHHFHQEVRTEVTPTDPFFASQQWHLSNAAYFGADYNANIKAPNAWTGSQTYGSAGVVVAVLDNGVQTDHPDLSARIRPGYDFRSGDNDPGPASGADNHGTAVAGMVAASANGSGSVGAAPNVRILPVRMMTGETDEVAPQTIADAVTWAADNADILNCSWKTPPHSLITAAFSYAATSGRAGKGAIVTAAKGNTASKWVEITDDFISPGANVPAGTWRYRFIMQNNSYNPGQKSSRAHIAYVRFPNGTIERFDTTGIPSGWTLDTPTRPWSTIDDLSKSHGVGRYFLASSTYLDQFQTSSVTTPAMTHGSTARIKFLLYITNADADVPFKIQRLRLDGGQWVWDADIWGQFGWGGSSENTTIAYPASLTTTIAVGASTDWDYRADYSNFTVDGSYGGILDFVAPSGGGYMGVFTTDRTGSAGYNTFNGNQDYAVLSGTSFASPIAAGVAALVLSRNGHLTATQVRDAMRNSATKVKSGTVNYVNGHNTYFGYGRLDAAAAVAAVTPDTTLPTLAAVSVQTTRSIDVTFSEPMGGGVYSTPPPGFPNPAYTISGAGKGTLQDRPSSVIRLSPTKYRLVWPVGGMVNGTVTVTVTSPMDVAGNLASSAGLNSTGTTAIELVNCGGSTVYPYGSGDPRTPWLLNSYWLGNQFVQYTTSGSSGSTSSSINMSGVSSPAPQAVYQSGRMRWYADGTPAQWLTYNLPGVLPGENVKVRLHFSEMYWSNIGDQIFNIRINNSNPANYPNYWNYDILGATGGYQNTARVLEFNLTHGSGPLRIDLEQRPSSGQYPYYNATINGIEVLRQ